MRRFVVSCLLGAATLTLGPTFASVRAAAPSVPGPYVSPFVSALPGRSFEETVMTPSAEPVQVTVTRIPDVDVLAGYTSDPRDPHQALNLQYPVVFQTKVDYDRQIGGGFEHHIAIPPQRPGLYEILLAAEERTALQQFVVGTVGAVADFEFDDSALLAIDTRTMRRRSDVSLTGYTNTQRQVFRPGPDGLIHLSHDFWGTSLPHWPLGKLILTAPDGSILPLNYLIGIRPTARAYFDTDRNVYWGGDRAHYELITRGTARGEETPLSISGPGTNIVGQVVLNGPIATGTVTLPSVTSGVYSFAIDGERSALSILDARTSKYEITAHAATPRVAIGEPVKFVLSVRTLAGQPAASVRIPYAWNFRAYIGGPIPIATALSLEPDLKRAAIVTDGDGNATVVIATPKDRAAPVELVLYDPDTNALIAIALAQTSAPIPSASNSPVSISPPANTLQGESVSVSARGGAESDAILRYGSPPNFRWSVVSFERNVARFSISAPSDEDFVPVSVMTATDSEDVPPPQQLLVTRLGEPHRLRVALGCYQHEYKSGQSIGLCVRIRDSLNRPVVSNVTVTIREATAADVAAAEGSGDAPYSDLYYPPGEQGILYSSVITWKAAPPIAYLYPETRRVPHFAGLAYGIRGPRQPVTPVGPETKLPPQTLYWLDQVATDKNGALAMKLPWPIAARSAMYVIRTTAATSRGEVGQAFAFVHYRAP